MMCANISPFRFFQFAIYMSGPYEEDIFAKVYNFHINFSWFAVTCVDAFVPHK